MSFIYSDTIAKTLWVKPTRQLVTTMTYLAKSDICSLTGKPHEKIVQVIGLMYAPISSFNQNQECDCGKYTFQSWEMHIVCLPQLTDTAGNLYNTPPVGALFDILACGCDPFNIAIKMPPDGIKVACQTPAGIWYIDSRAPNCSMPTDRNHNCWIRHGTFGDDLTVDKIGRTCRNGGGVNIMPDFSGYLTQGELRQVSNGP